MELFAEQTLTNGTNTYTFTSIPQTHKNLRIFVHGSMHPTYPYGFCSLRFNSNTSSSQHSGMSGWAGNGGYVTGNTYNNSEMYFPVLAGPTSTSNSSHSVVELIIPNYSESTSDGYKSAHGQAYFLDNTASYCSLMLSSMRSRVTAAITTLTFVTPTSAYLYNDPRIVIYGE